MAEDAELDNHDDRFGWFFACLTSGEGWKFLDREVDLLFGRGACLRLWRHLCGAENLVHRFRTECFQLPDGPTWSGVSLEACPALGGGESHSDSFGDPAELRCCWCGAQPFWPLHGCDAREHGVFFLQAGPWRFPHLCSRVEP